MHPDQYDDPSDLDLQYDDIGYFNRDRYICTDPGCEDPNCPDDIRHPKQ